MSEDKPLSPQKVRAILIKGGHEPTRRHKVGGQQLSGFFTGKGGVKSVQVFHHYVLRPSEAARDALLQKYRETLEAEGLHVEKIHGWLEVTRP